MITGEDVKRWKPDPEPALLALHILRKSAADTLFMGDQLADLGCARSAGIHFAAALWESFQVERLVAEKPEWIFRKPDEFYVWIEREIELRIKNEK
jgi:phosphoglycolate phosphatase-like HAD superfamily hydrolase